MAIYKDYLETLLRERLQMKIEIGGGERRNESSVPATANSPS
jgi:hypothetical protein